MAALPLSVVPLAIYVLAALFLAPADPPVASIGAWWDNALVSVTLVSGVRWTASYGDALVALALALLIVTVLRCVAARARDILANLLSIVVLGVHVVMFLALGLAGTSVFFLLTVVALAEALTRVSASLAAATAPASPGADTQ